MATITTDTYFDAAARTAGESWTINGATLTIRTDTRWHANSPASMTGTIGQVDISGSLGGSMVIDGTKVRWLAYDTGTGNVPAVGTSITQGSVSGYLLGVWVDHTTAPTAVGAAMPASGFIKLREVTGGPYTTGALSGIGANATAADVVGWIEIVKDQSTTLTSSILGDGLVINGDWYELGTTSGSAGQTFYIPVNGGGSSTNCIGVQIETASGSGVYEWWPCVASATFTTTNFYTDARSKVLQSMGSGQVRIGSNGTSNIGYVPPSGCKIRMPNVICRIATTAARASNMAPGNTSNVTVDKNVFDKAYFEWSFNTTTSVITGKLNISNSVLQSLNALYRALEPVTISYSLLGGYINSSFSLQSCDSTTLTGVKICSVSSNVTSLTMNACKSVSFTNLEVIYLIPRTTAFNTISFTNTNGIIISGLKVKQGRFSLAACSNVSISTIDYCDTLKDSYNANGHYFMTMTNNSDVIIDGFTFGEAGTITTNGVNCTNEIFNVTTNNVRVKIRNIGTRSSPLAMGSTSSNYLVNFSSTAASNIDWKVQRCYLASTAQSVIGGIAASNTTSVKNFLFEDIKGSTSAQFDPAVNNGIYRKITGLFNAAAMTGTQGTHWVDGFTSDTAGIIRWYGCAPSTTTSDKNFITDDTAKGTGYIYSTGELSLDTQNGYATSEISYWIKGHTGFQNSNPTLGGTTTGLSIYYDLDKGSGFSGSWTAATGANLSAESGLSASGFKIKIKILQTSASGSASALTYITFLTNTTVTDQVDNMFPLDTVTLSFEGLQPGSEVRAYIGTDPATATEIGGIESVSGTTWSFTHSNSGQDGYIAIFALGYNPLFIPRTYAYTDSSLLIQQVVDRTYSNPA